MGTDGPGAGMRWLLAMGVPMGSHPWGSRCPHRRGPAGCGAAQGRLAHKLLHDLFANYSSALRPAEDTERALNVTLQVTLSQIIDMVSAVPPLAHPASSKWAQLPQAALDPQNQLQPLSTSSHPPQNASTPPQQPGTPKSLEINLELPWKPAQTILGWLKPLQIGPDPTPNQLQTLSINSDLSTPVQIP